MEILTETDCLGTFNHPQLEQHTIFRYKDKGITFIPKNFIQTWDSNIVKETPVKGRMYLGKCTTIGVGSSIRYNENATDMLICHRFNSIGSNVRFILYDSHSYNHMTTYVLGLINLQQPLPPSRGNILIENDVFIGDNSTILAGANLQNGCLIGARSMVLSGQILEPYGIYVGNPAKLLKFRFDPKIIELLLEIKWWNLPVDWIEQNTKFFQFDFNQDLAKSIDLLQELKSCVPA